MQVLCLILNSTLVLWVLSQPHPVQTSEVTDCPILGENWVGLPKKLISVASVRTCPSTQIINFHVNCSNFIRLVS